MISKSASKGRFFYSFATKIYFLTYVTMNKLLPIIGASILTLLSYSCSALLGEEVARLPINQVSTDDDNLIIMETTLSLKQGEEIAFWSDIDIAYEGPVALRFRIEILIDGQSIDTFEIDPTDKNITMGEVKTTVMDKTNWSFTGKNYDILIEESGEYTFKAFLVASENPSLVIDKAELVIKK